MEQPRAEHRRLRPPIGLSVGVVLSVLGASLFAMKEIANTLNAPTWLTVSLVALGLVTVAGDKVIDSRRKARAKEAETARQAEQRKRTLMGRLRFGPPLPSLSSLGPDEIRRLGIEHSEIAERYRKDAAIPPYLPRTVDEGLQDALRTEAFVLLVGPSAAGKSRTAYEAGLSVHGQAELIVPVSPDRLRPLLTLEPPLELTGDAALLWLDDLERYLETGLTLGDVRPLEALGTKVVTLATMRHNELNRFQEVPTARELLDTATTLRLPEEPGSWDAQAAADAYPDLQFDERGIGATLIEKQALLAKYERGTRLRVALVRAAADWRRAGMEGPIPERELKDLARFYAAGELATAARYEDAFEWATEELTSSASLLTPVHGGERFEVSQAVLERDETAAREVPDETWQFVLEHVDDQDVLSVGVAAHSRKRLDVAEEAYRRAAQAGDVIAASNLGVVLEERGATKEAERCYRQAAEAHYPGGAYNVGRLLTKQGRLDEGERWLRQAAEAGRPLAASALGVLLANQGRLDEAMHWVKQGMILAERHTREAGRDLTELEEDALRLAQALGKSGEAER